ncbi:lysozyme inhibitor LprI family protein [Phyllobacterium meliloti]|uniref:lysozyme inhibitor LprI family protein n=1 Tax=Phyllobacterium meliloti TaxID=555317 RepID=UPI001D157DD6|nr:lysozyme inhibitor LprI family protein [Phyllobacterium sp. T1293]UGX85007.1 DUF1311 domain-containing protein [Phyllobacterium sp. T1293]
MKRFYALLCVSLTLGAAAPAFAASPEEKVDPIDKAANECLAKPEGQTTAGMVDCTHKAFVAYDKQLNEVYKKVLATVDAESAKQIRDAQRKWVAWREAQIKADDGPWRADRGSLASMDIEAMNVDAVRARIKELQYYAP